MAIGRDLCVENVAFVQKKKKKEKRRRRKSIMHWLSNA